MKQGENRHVCMFTRGGSCRGKKADPGSDSTMLCSLQSTPSSFNSRVFWRLVTFRCDADATESSLGAKRVYRFDSTK